MDSGKALTDYKSEIEKNGAISFVPGGNSMWPILKNKRQSVIVCKKTERLGEYDVAFFVRANGTFVLHRVMEVLPDGYIICGDSQFSLEKVEEDKVFGKMTGFYKGKKYIDVRDKSYVKKVKKWYARKKTRKLKLKIFYKLNGYKALIKRILKGKDEGDRDDV